MIYLKNTQRSLYNEQFTNTYSKLSGVLQISEKIRRKTLKAYRIDLQQFSKNIRVKKITEINSHILENYIASLHLQYQPKTVKRKIATLKAFFHYLEYKDIVSQSPLNRMQIHFREPIKLPKTIPLHTLELFLSTIYDQCEHAPTLYQRRNALRDAAVAELLFSSGMRISELCSLSPDNINLYDGTILIYGKGSKERRIQIGNNEVLDILRKYKKDFTTENQLLSLLFCKPKQCPLIRSICA